MSKSAVFVRGFFLLVVMAAAITVAGSMTLIVASDAVLQTEFLGEATFSYTLWAGAGYLAILTMFVKAYSDHFTDRLTPDPDLVSIEDLFTD